MATESKRSKRQVGKQFEKLAQDFLENHRLQTIARNYTTRTGEIDLVMRDSQALVFVEVRYRKSSFFGTAAESIDQQKQNKIIQAAQQFIADHPYQGAIRFDIVCFNGSDPKPQWLQNAFAPLSETTPFDF